YEAEISELLHAERRDEEHLKYLESEFSKAIKDLVGVDFWIRYYKYIPILAKFAYYASTTLSGLQTLGEEYLSLLQISDVGNRSIPSLWRRLYFIILHIFLPFLIDESLPHLRRYIIHSDTHSFLGVRLIRNRKARRTFVQIIDWLRLKGIPSLSRLHLAVFYLLGKYYSISKRASGITYITFRAQSNLVAFWIFRFLGYLTFLQAFIAISTWFYENFSISIRSVKSDKSTSESHSDFHEDSEDSNTEDRLVEVNPRFHCPICSTTRYPSCIPCGHLFCWRCIIQHAHNCVNIDETTPCCPQCRAKFEANRVIPIFNL
uniref:RING-type E3 ubiquitin transferase n=1 Tax=Parascaris univalens TaxID=6257 RepID=A0A915APS9_PARUN